MTVQSQILTQEEKVIMEKMINSISGKIILVILTTVVLSGIIPFLFLVNQTILPWALKWTAIAMVGIVAGLSSRSLLKDSSITLKFLASVIAVFQSLWILGYLSQGYIGIELPRNPNAGIDWVGLGQLGFGSSVSFIVLKAWQITLHPVKKRHNPIKKQPRLQKTKVSKTKRNPPVKINKTTRKRIMKSHRIVDKRRVSQPPLFLYLPSQFKRLKEKTYSLWVNSQSTWMRSEEKFNSRYRKTKLQLTNLPVKIPSMKTEKQKKEIQIVGEEEHRCPYCLELVDQNDSHGVVECPICHTLHHADCWAVTGTCQVPHLFE